MADVVRRSPDRHNGTMEGTTEPPPWLSDIVPGQVSPLIESDERVIRVQAGPGTGKTLGIPRRHRAGGHGQLSGARGAARVNPADPGVVEALRQRKLVRSAAQRSTAWRPSRVAWLRCGSPQSDRPDRFPLDEGQRQPDARDARNVVGAIQVGLDRARLEDSMNVLRRRPVSRASSSAERVRWLASSWSAMRPLAAAGLDGEPGHPPLRKTVLEAPRSKAARPKQIDALWGQHAVRAATIRDDVSRDRHLRKPCGQLVERDGHGSRNVPCLVLGVGSQIEHRDCAGANASPEGLASDRLGLVGTGPGRRPPPAGPRARGHVRRPEGRPRAHTPRRPPGGNAWIVDPDGPTISPAARSTCRCDEVSATLICASAATASTVRGALCENIDDLEPARARKCLPDPGELLVERHLRSMIRRHSCYSNELFEYLSGGERMDIQTFTDEGLGNSTYLVEIGDRRALAHRPPARRVGPPPCRPKRRDLSIAYSVETHLHADFVSGSRELAAVGATVVGCASIAKLAFPHRRTRGRRRRSISAGLTPRGDRDARSHARSTCHTCFGMARSPVALVLGRSAAAWARSRGPTSSRRTRRSRSRGPSTARSTIGSWRSPTTSPSTRPTAGARSARRGDPASGPRRSAASGRRTRLLARAGRGHLRGAPAPSRSGPYPTYFIAPARGESPRGPG